MKSEITPLMVFVTAVVALTLITTLVVPPAAAGNSPIVVGHNTTIIAENGITLDNLVVNENLTVGGVLNPFIEKSGGTMTGDLTLQDNVKLFLNTARTLGLYTDPTNFGSDVLILASAIKNLVSPAGLAIYANAGEDGLGNWAPYVYFRADGHLQLIAAAGKEIQTSGDIVMGSNNLTIGAGYTLDGVDVGSHRHSGGTGDGPVLDGDNCLKDENLNLGTGSLTTTHTISRHIMIPSSNFGKPVTNPPTVDVYGICHVLEFTVGTDKAYYKFHIPADWVPGTDILTQIHWTRSTTGSEENTKTVKWQMKYLAVDGVSQNINAGESTLSVQDTYDSSSTTDQIVYQTEVTVPESDLSLGDCVVIELMAIAPTGTALSEPACAAAGITYTAYQFTPP